MARVDARLCIRHAVSTYVHTNIYIHIYIYAYAYTHKSGARVLPTKLLTRKKTGLEKERARAVGSGEGAREMPQEKGTAVGTKSGRGGEGGRGGHEARNLELELARSGMDEDGARRATGRGRVKERKRLDRISSLRVTMGGSIEKII